MPDSLLTTRFTAEAAALREALTAVSPCLPRRNTPKPVLHNVLLAVEPGGVSSLAATDLEVGVRFDLAGVRADAACRVLLPPSRLVPILAHTAAADIEFELDGETLTVTSAGYRFELCMEDPATYPTLPEPPGEGPGTVLVEASALRRMIRRTKYATDPESTRYALGGVLFELATAEPGHVAMVATDGRRVARQAAPAHAIGAGGVGGGRLDPAAREPVVPVKALNLVERAVGDDDGEIAVSGDRTHSLFFSGGRGVVSTRLVEGRFPRYQDCFPGGPPSRVPVRAGELRDRFDLAGVLTSEESKGVDVTVTPGRVTFRSTAAERGKGEADMGADYDGPTLEFTIDPRFVCDALASLEPDMALSLEVIDGKQAVTLRETAGAGPGGGLPPPPFLYLVMPLTRER